MKIVLLLLSSLFFTTACQTKKESVATVSQTVNTSEKIPNTTQESMIVEYEALSRGFYSKIMLENNQIAISKDRDNQAISKKITISKADQIEITNLLANLKPESLLNLIGPTEKRFHDGAAHANLKITKNGKSYETQGFDAGFPPKEIEKLVTKLVSLSEKQ